MVPRSSSPDSAALSCADKSRLFHAECCCGIISYVCMIAAILGIQGFHMRCFFIQGKWKGSQLEKNKAFSLCCAGCIRFEVANFFNSARFISKASGIPSWKRPRARRAPGHEVAPQWLTNPHTNTKAHARAHQHTSLAAELQVVLLYRIILTFTFAILAVLKTTDLLRLSPCTNSSGCFAN